MNIDEELNSIKGKIAVKQLAELAQLVALTEEELAIRLADPHQLLNICVSLQYARHSAFGLLSEEGREEFDKLMKANVVTNARSIMDVIDSFVERIPV